MPRYRYNGKITIGKYDEWIKPNEEKDLLIYLKSSDELEVVNELPAYTPIIEDILINKDDFDTLTNKYIFEIPYDEWDEYILFINPIIKIKDDVNQLEYYNCLYLYYNHEENPKTRLYNPFFIKRLTGKYKRLIFEYDIAKVDDLRIHIQVIQEKLF